VLTKQSWITGGMGEEDAGKIFKKREREIKELHRHSSIVQYMYNQEITKIRYFL
jgi:hypothetical protein